MSVFLLGVFVMSGMYSYVIRRSSPHSSNGVTPWCHREDLPRRCRYGTRFWTPRGRSLGLGETVPDSYRRQQRVLVPSSPVQPEPQESPPLRSSPVVVFTSGLGSEVQNPYKVIGWSEVNILYLCLYFSS